MVICKHRGESQISPFSTLSFNNIVKLLLLPPQIYSSTSVGAALIYAIRSAALQHCRHNGAGDPLTRCDSSEHSREHLYVVGLRILHCQAQGRKTVSWQLGELSVKAILATGDIHSLTRINYICLDRVFWLFSLLLYIEFLASFKLTCSLTR